jgi:hypothetical protein
MLFLSSRRPQRRRRPSFTRVHVFLPFLLFFIPVTCSLPLHRRLQCGNGNCAGDHKTRIVRGRNGGIPSKGTLVTFTYLSFRCHSHAIIERKREASKI